MPILAFLTSVLTAGWEILLDAAPFVLLGFFFAGVTRALLRDETVARHLGNDGAASVIKAALLGIPLPLCSCGVLPAAAGLRRQGASRGATSAFLISTPETGLDSIAVSWALLDPLLTIFRPLAALFTAVVAGLLETWSPPPPATVKGPQPLPMLTPAAACCDDDVDEEDPTGMGARLRAGLRFAFGDLLRDIGPWLLLGVAVAAVITALIPAGFLESHLGGGLPTMLAMLLVGIPLYLCASASTPIAAALILKGLSPGAALVFLLAGPATNSATMIAVARLLGRRSLVLYLAAIAICSVLCGLLLDFLYPFFNLDPATVVGSIGEAVPYWLSLASLLLLLALFLWHSRPRRH